LHKSMVIMTHFLQKGKQNKIHRDISTASIEK
jgi:hypothetical protein